MNDEQREICKNCIHYDEYRKKTIFGAIKMRECKKIKEVAKEQIENNSFEDMFNYGHVDVYMPDDCKFYAPKAHICDCCGRQMESYVSVEITVGIHRNGGIENPPYHPKEICPYCLNAIEDRIRAMSEDMKRGIGNDKLLRM